MISWFKSTFVRCLILIKTTGVQTFGRKTKRLTSLCVWHIFTKSVTPFRFYLCTAPHQQKENLTLNIYVKTWKALKRAPKKVQLISNFLIYESIKPDGRKGRGGMVYFWVMSDLKYTNLSYNLILSIIQNPSLP